MTRYRITNSWCRTEGEVTVGSYVERALNGSDYERGQIETLEASTMNAHKAFGLLIETLVNKGVLSVTDVNVIANHYDKLEIAE